MTFLAFPFYWMLITTFKTTQDLHDTANNPYLFNDPPTLEHLRLLFEETQYLQWLINTASSALPSSRSRSPWRCPPDTRWRG